MSLIAFESMHFQEKKERICANGVLNLQKTQTTLRFTAIYNTVCAMTLLYEAY